MDPQSQKLVSNKELKKYKEQPNRDEEYNNWKKKYTRRTQEESKWSWDQKERKGQ